MHIEVPNINLILFHNVNLILLLTSHLDVDNRGDELLRFLISDEHFLEIDHLL